MEPLQLMEFMNCMAPLKPTEPMKFEKLMKCNLDVAHDATWQSHGEERGVIHEASHMPLQHINIEETIMQEIAWQNIMQET